MVCIIDDREDIWDCAPNLVTVKPYRFFLGTGDINAPFGADQAFTHPSAIPMHEDPDVLDGASKTSTARGHPRAPAEDGAAGRMGAQGEEKVGKIEVKYEEAPSKSLDVSEETNHDEIVDKGDCRKAMEQRALPNHISVTETRDRVEDNCLIDRINGEVAYKEEEEQESRPRVAGPSVTADVAKEPKDTEPNRFETGAELTNEDGTGECMAECANDTTVSAANDAGKDGEQKDALYNCSKTVDVKEAERHDGDSDDYLLYLGDILHRIHTRFYDMLDNPRNAEDGGESPVSQPDLRTIMPGLRQSVLSGTNIVFTGVIPTNCKVEESQVWRVASQFGANVTKDLMTRKNTAERGGRTTHVVAARPGTEKACQALRYPDVKLVNPNWLWTCAERWELVDERLFPVEDYEKYKARKRDTPPPLRQTDSGNSSTDIYTKDNSGNRRRPLTPRDDPTSSEDFTDVMNPFLSFSSGEMEDMDKEVEDLMRSSEDEGEGDEILGSVSSSSSSAESEASGSFKLLGESSKGRTVHFSTIHQTQEMPITKCRKLDFSDGSQPPNKILKTDENVVSDDEFSEFEESADSGSSDEDGNEMAAMLEAAIYS